MTNDERMGMSVTHRRYVPYSHAHYGGNLVDGAYVLSMFGDVATELLIRTDGDEGRADRPHVIWSGSPDAVDAALGPGQKRPASAVYPAVPSTKLNVPAVQPYMTNEPSPYVSVCSQRTDHQSSP